MLIVGLGNPDKKYRLTRHNVGHIFVDYVDKCQMSNVKCQKKLQSCGRKACQGITSEVSADLTSEVGELAGFPSRLSEAEFLKTKGVYMNDSGKFVARELKRRALKPDQLILIHDDLDLPLGEFKFQFGRGDAGHKGVRSVAEVLGTKGFWRLRIGIGRPADGGNPEDYVLKEFSANELVRFKKVLPLIKVELASKLVNFKF